METTAPKIGFEEARTTVKEARASGDPACVLSAEKQTPITR